MKKLVVLALLLAACMLWAQAPAAPWSDPHKMDMGVTLDYMWSQDFGAGKTFSDRPILELKFNWVADDFTSVYVELEEGPLSSRGDTQGGNSGLQGGFRNVYSTNADKGYDVKIEGLDRAYFTTDVAKALKWKMPVVVMYGLNEWNGKDGIKATKSEYEDFLGEADIRNWGAQIEVMPNPAVTIRSNWAWNWNASKDAADVDLGGQWILNAYGTVKEISYEVTYDTHGFSFDKGWIEGGVKYVKDMSKDLNVAAMAAFQVDLASTTDYVNAGIGDANHYFAYGFGPIVTDSDILVAPTSFWQVQAGLQVMYQKMFAFGLSYRGAADMLAGAIQPQIYFTPKAGDPLEVLAQLGLGLDSDAFDTMFDSFEIALRYTMGKAAWYLGAWYAAEYSRGVAKEWQDFDLADIPGGNGGFNVFMRGRVAL